MKKIIGTLFLGAAFHLQAATFEMVGTVEEIMLDKEETYRTYFKVTGTSSGDRPGCHANSQWTFVVNDDSVMGQKMLSTLLTMNSTGKSGKFIGDGYCTGDTEKIKRIILGHQ